jgi:molybdopterin biosynthesis enzyme
MQLYDLDARIRELLDSADTETGEIPEEALAEIEALEVKREERLLAMAAYVLELEAEADAVKAEADRLAHRARTTRNRAEWIEARIAASMTPGEKLADATVRLSWRRSEAVEVEPGAELPEDCVRVIPEQREPDKKALRDALHDGREVAGVKLATRWHLSIR